MTNIMTHTRRRSDRTAITNIMPEKIDAIPLETAQKSCQKCGRQMTRGLFVHEKYCKG